MMKLERGNSYKELALKIAKRARDCSHKLKGLDSASKNNALSFISEAILSHSKDIINENKKDLKRAIAKGLSSAFLDRLSLDEQRIEAMARSVKEVMMLSDPVGEIVRIWTRPNGLRIGKMRIPLGVILIIYESRPNVTVEASSLCLKSGNAVILRGGSEALSTNIILGELMRSSLEKAGIQADSIQVLHIPDRRLINELLLLDEYLDLVIPRGGEGLIRNVVRISRIPVLKHYKGVCHIFVDRDADLKKAYRICFNAKVQRPGVCNAMETLLVDASIAKKFLPKMCSMFKSAKVELRGCSRTREIIKGIKKATEEDFYAEYLDLILSIKVVDGIDEAIEHIEKYGSDHTEAIITENYSRAMEFIRRVDSSSVMVNASTRFSDGYEYGLGAEIGISTTRLHAYGPMGLEELTTTKFLVFGDGQIRE